jgi:hypothetical protein
MQLPNRLAPKAPGIAVALTAREISSSLATAMAATSREIPSKSGYSNGTDLKGEPVKSSKQVDRMVGQQGNSAMNLVVHRQDSFRNQTLNITIVKS